MTPDITFDEHSTQRYAIKVNGRWVGHTDEERTIKRISEWLEASWGELMIAVLANAHQEPAKKKRSKKA